MEKEVRYINIMVNPASGSARGFGSIRYTMSVPSKFARTLGFVKEDRRARLTFDGKRITIKKAQEGQEEASWTNGSAGNWRTRS